MIPTLPPGVAGTNATLKRMRRMARQGSVMPIVRKAAADIIRGVGPRDARAQAAELRGWLREFVKFMRDPADVELVQAPDNMLRDIATRRLAQGDCDDVATLAAALGLAIGLNARFVVLSFAEGAPFSHVYTELQAPTGGDWYDLDVFRGIRTYPSGTRAAAMRV